MVMDIFTLARSKNDNNFEYYTPDKTITGWSSLIWTERYNDISDFKVTFRDIPGGEPEIMTLYKGGGIDRIPFLIGCNASNEVMMVETIETKFSRDQGPVIEISGKSILDIFNYRIWTPTSLTDGGPDSRNWTENIRDDWLTSTYKNDDVGNRIQEMINNYGASATRSQIAFKDDNIRIPIECRNSVSGITKSENTLQSGILWPIIKKMMDEYHIGIQVSRVHDWAVRGSSAVFAISVYQGRDLTDSVVFSEDNNTLIASSTLQTRKNSVDIILGHGSTWSHRWQKPIPDKPGWAWDTKGFARRYGYINSKELRYLDAEVMFQERSPKYLVTGEIAPSNRYEYRRDYYRGDKVKFRALDGNTSNVYVKEFIYSEDENGFKQYPTFESET